MLKDYCVLTNNMLKDYCVLAYDLLKDYCVSTKVNKQTKNPNIKYFYKLN